MNTILNRKIFIVLIFVLMVFGTFAQQTSSSLSGRIFDPSAEGLPGATLQVVFTPTNTSYGVVTNKEGRYFLANLNPGGPYEITVTFVGYKTEKFTNINLRLGETQKLDVVLEIDNQVLHEVSIVGVNEEATEKSGTGTSISRE